MNTVTRIAHMLKAGAALLVTAVGILFIADDDENEDRPLGDHNFRTGRMDSGTDPDGWYEEDL